MATIQDLKKYIGYEFSSGCYTGEDYKSFQTKYINYLRSICKQNHWQLVNVGRNHYCFSAFIKSAENKCVYVSISDVRYFSKYYAPEYSPALGQYAVQENPDIRVKTGAYPIVNAYANFHLKNTRFFVMMSHVNYSEGGEYFLTPHYPLNQRIIRFGLSWNFFN